MPKNTVNASKNSFMRKLVYEFDWSKTSLGPIKEWPQSLRTSVNIVLNSPVPIVMLWGPDGYLIYNDSYSVFAGARHPSLLGRKAVDGWPEVADFNINVIKECYENGRRLSYVDQPLTLHRNNVAEHIWTNLDYSPIEDESGKPAGIFALVIETTERVLAEAERKKAEAIVEIERNRLESFLKNAPAYIAVLNGPNHVFTLTNSLFKRLTGGRDIIGKAFRDALPELGETGLYEIMDNVYKTGEPFLGNEVLVGLDRTGMGIVEPGIFNFVYQPIINEDKQVTDILVHAVEVTEQINARRELDEAKRMFDALFDSNVVAVALASTNGDVIQANSTFLKLFGYKQSDLKNGLTSRQLTAPGYESVTKGIYKSVQTKGEAEPTETRYITKNGTEFPGLVAAAMLPDSKDEFMAFILDISENEKLKEVNTAKDEFIAIASHQLRTPATSVKQYIGVLINGMAGPLSPDQLKYLDIANKANNRQLDIINDLLKTAEIDVKGYSLSINNVDLVKLVKDLIEQYLPVLNAKDQTFNFKTSEKSLYVLADETEISKCLGNLVENASKYSANGKIVTIELIKLTKEAKIVIKDQGVGIAQADYNKIFEKFTRVDNELSDTVSGNGLGLYWVKRIIELHHGNISISSKVGNGTSFSVRLPI